MIEENISEVSIKILRLSTGEDIIGTCWLDDVSKSVGIENPLKIHLQRSTFTGKSMLYMLPWLPVEIIEDNYATINYSDVITTILPKKSMIEHYNNTIEELESRLYDEKKDEFDDDGDFDDEQEETLESILSMLQEPKKEIIH